MRCSITLCLVIWFQMISSAQCDPYTAPQSPRLANYVIKGNLDHGRKVFTGSQQLTWINHSPEAITAIPFYMYMNAFKNTSSTWIKGAEGQVFGQNLASRKEEDWGWIEVVSAIDQNGTELIGKSRYIQPDDGNEADESVLEMNLDDPLLPGDTLVLNMEFITKMPRTIARAGYANGDFFLFVHWFPQAGVLEQDRDGKWGFNCHQFMRQTEFYGDFGNYDFEITLDKKFVVGASGCIVDSTLHSNGTKTLSFHAEDVIDYAWCAYPDFNVIKKQWEHVEIKLLVAPEHMELAPRLLTAVTNSLEYLGKHVGPYPYPTITVMDPPFHALRNGFMEYPTFITGGSFKGFPKWIKTMESLIVHEFTHQYFMGVLASNEKEEAWLDEGFVTYFEDRIQDHYFGKGQSMFDILGVKIGSSESSRLEYTSMENPRVGTITRPSWEITRDYKELVYSKTGLILRTMEKMVGLETMDAVMMDYFESFKFKHPRGEEFFQSVDKSLTKLVSQELQESVKQLLHQGFNTTAVLDYNVVSITTGNEYETFGLVGDQKNMQFEKTLTTGKVISKATVERLGDFILPTTILFQFSDGTTETKAWDAKDQYTTFVFKNEAPLISVHIDPEEKLLIDLNLNNNSLTIQKEKRPFFKYAFKAINWLISIVQSISIAV